MNIVKVLGLGLVIGAAPLVSVAHAQGIGGLIPTPENPPTRQGTRGGNFLHIPIGARGNAMGGAIGSTVSGSMALFWNPAGASSAEGFELAGGRQNLYGNLGLNQTYAAAVLPLLGGVIGVSVDALSSGDIVHTTEDLPLGSDAIGATFDWNSTAVGLGYARRLTDRLSVGVQGKYIQEGITDASISWAAVDVGTQFNTGIYGLIIGGALQQIGGSARAQGPAVNININTADVSLEQTRVDLFTRDLELPTTFQFSVGSTLLGSAESLFGGAGGQNSLIAEVTTSSATDQATQLGIGAEYSFRKLLYLRAGKRFYNDDRDAEGNFSFGLSGGIGLRVPVGSRSIRLDFSHTNMGDLQNIQVFSFELGQ